MGHYISQLTVDTSSAASLAMAIVIAAVFTDVVASLVYFNAQHCSTRIHHTHYAVRLLTTRVCGSLQQ
jgi:hypothetical protein